MYSLLCPNAKLSLILFLEIIKLLILSPMSEDSAAEVFGGLTQLVEVSAFSGSCHLTSICAL